MLGREMRWRLVVLRKDLFQVNSVVISLKSTARLSSSCSSHGSWVPAEVTFDEKTQPQVLCCEPPEKDAVTAEQACSCKMATCE